MPAEAEFAQEQDVQFLFIWHWPEVTLLELRTHVLQSNLLYQLVEVQNLHSSSYINLSGHVLLTILVWYRFFLVLGRSKWPSLGVFSGSLSGVQVLQQKQNTSYHARKVSSNSLQLVQPNPQNNEYLLNLAKGQTLGRGEFLVG